MEDESIARRSLYADQLITGMAIFLCRAGSESRARSDAFLIVEIVPAKKGGGSAANYDVSASASTGGSGRTVNRGGGLRRAASMSDAQ